MKHLRLAIILALVPFLAFAQDFRKGDNSVPDSITGEYFISYGGNTSRVRFTRNSDGTYRCKTLWVEHCTHKDGSKILDRKNPDKSLRGIPVDRIVIMDGLQYDAARKVWNGARIYDPTRGIRAKVTASFESDGLSLRLRATVLGIGETVVWKKTGD